jgi:hypothetical protein
MDILTIILFFVYTWGLGFTLTSLLKLKTENFYEKHLMNIGIGLGTIPLLIVLMNLFRIPLDWKIFLALSIIYPLFLLIKSYKKILTKLQEFNWKPNFKFKKSSIAILIVLFLFAATFFMYHKGAFAYPYLENEDPWSHAVGAKYVALEKTVYDPQLESISHGMTYLDPYPPGYDGFMGILLQTNDSVNWTLKFFNALIISLSLIFFFFFAQRFTGNRNKALFATFVLAAVPCFFSHFIWAHSLAITLLFPALYCLERIKDNKRWFYLAGISMSGIALSHLISQPLKLAVLLLVYLIVVGIFEKKLRKYFAFAALLAIALSFVWYGDMMIQHGGLSGITGNTYETGSAQAEGFKDAKGISGFFGTLKLYFPADGGTATRAYTMKDFFVAQPYNMINAPIGIGIVVSVLLIIGLIFILLRYKSLFKERNSWLLVTLIWFIFVYFGVNTMTYNLPIGLVAFRFWLLLGIPVALLAAEGTWFFMGLFKKYHALKFIILVLIIVGILFTSASQKYSFNTTTWPTSSAWSGGSMEEPFEYGAWFNSIPKNTKVFTFSNRDKLVIGFDSYSCMWCENVDKFRNGCILDKSNEELYDLLKSEGYEYLLFGRMTTKYVSKTCSGENIEEIINQRLRQLLSLKGFDVVYHKENMFVVLKVN